MKNTVLILFSAYVLHINQVGAFLPPSTTDSLSYQGRSLTRTKISFDEKEYDLFGKNKKPASNNSPSGLVGIDIPLGKEQKGDALSSLTSEIKGDTDKEGESDMSGLDVDKEALLAELIFGTDDVREMIFRRIDDCGEPFIDFLNEKIDNSSDLEERAALRSLIDIIGSVQTAYDNFKKEEEQKAADMKLKMAEEEAKLLKEIEEKKIQAKLEEEEGKSKAKQEEAQKAKELAIQKTEREKQMKDIANAEQSYEQLLTAFLSLDFNDPAYVKEVVKLNYEQCTIEFLNLMGDKMIDPSTDATEKEKMETLKAVWRDFARTND